jgi:hypothetical protein
MTFEEFFIKKRIDLPALEQAEPALFSEFKTHFNQMGEKSFDHTKKYWFNKLRRQFHLAPELKPEKVAIANPLAEQTITESLSEPASIPTPAKQGFTPRFKAANMPKPAIIEEKTDETPAATESAPIPTPPKVGFTPRFKAANMPKPAVNEGNAEEKPTDPAPSPEEKPARSDAPKPAYKPRFNMKNIPPQSGE